MSSSRLEWLLCTRSYEHELGGRYSVLLFFGDVPDAPADWLKPPSCCFGTHGPYTDNRRLAPEHDITTHGVIFLNKVLKRNLGLPVDALTHDVVVPYVRENLRWRVKMAASGEVVDNKELSSLEIEIHSRTAGQKRAGEATVYHL